MIFYVPHDNGWVPSDFGIVDRNDCAIRAIANVKTGKGYVLLREQMMELGRKANRATPWSVLDKLYQQEGAISILLWGSAGKKMKRYITNGTFVDEGITLRRFVDTHQKGRHIVIVRGHALALVNGKIIDTVYTKAGSRVIASYYFGE